MDTIEIWRDVPGYEGMYRVSTHGRVASYPRLRKNGKQHKDRIMRTAQKGGSYEYYQVLLTDLAGNRKKCMIHRLMAFAFIPNPDSKPEINHKNGNKHDNRLENLEWVTASENRQHSFANGLQLIQRGEKCRWAKLTDADVIKIKALLRSGSLTQKKIGEMFGVSRSCILNIKIGKDWKHIKQQNT